MKNSSLRSSGFTLVEVIISSVIVAVMATIGIMMYSGFVTDSRQQSVEQLAETAAAAASSYVRKTGSDEELDSAALRLYLTNPAEYSVEVNPDGGGIHGTVRITNRRHNISATKPY